jgi:hypothetical protein
VRIADCGRAACAEFPNDNPALHRGAIWRCPEPVQEAICVLPEALDALGNGLDAAAEGAGGEAFEVVDELGFGVLAFDEIVGGAPFACTGTAPDAAPPMASEPAEAPNVGDGFATLVRVLEEVAFASGGSDEHVACVRALLGAERLDERMHGGAASTSALVASGILERADGALVRARGFAAQVAGWQGVLRGQSEDFDACGGQTLDAWCSTLLACALGSSAHTERLRRELRRRGVAAFGLIAAAA